MMISTRGRYAIRLMIVLAEKGSSDYVRLKDISSEQNISQKYLEAITSVLSKNGLIDAAHGKGGGYKLNRTPQEYTVGEILRLTEGSLAPVSCLECGAKPCARAAECRTLPMWKDFDVLINNYFDGITLADLVGKKPDYEYVSASL
ncbi:MAG: Rrf2 family transcriptional regulator [Bacteroidales bacterium]|nr:Rrf2 family transcriptional regulator [Bacteroidales bacterium]